MEGHLNGRCPVKVSFCASSVLITDNRSIFNTEKTVEGVKVVRYWKFYNSCCIGFHIFSYQKDFHIKGLHIACLSVRRFVLVYMDTISIVQSMR